MAEEEKKDLEEVLPEETVETVAEETTPAEKENEKLSFKDKKGIGIDVSICLSKR